MRVGRIYYLNSCPMQSLGADEVVDYTKEDFAQKYKDEPFNAIVDLIGGDTELNVSPFRQGDDKGMNERTSVNTMRSSRCRPYYNTSLCSTDGRRRTHWITSRQSQTEQITSIYNGSAAC